MSTIEKEDVLTNIGVVTNGIVKDIGINNSFSSWLNTERGLRFIQEDTNKFNLGVKLWIEIVEQQILMQEIWEVFDKLKEQFIWLNNLKEIKEYSNLVNN